MENQKNMNVWKHKISIKIILTLELIKLCSIICRYASCRTFQFLFEYIIIGYCSSMSGEKRWNYLKSGGNIEHINHNDKIKSWKKFFAPIKSMQSNNSNSTWFGSFNGPICLLASTIIVSFISPTRNANNKTKR